MSRTSRAVWEKRVERWQSSGLTAKEFAAEIGVKAGTLSHWKWQLGHEARVAAKPKGSQKRSVKRAREPVSFTEVIVNAEQPSGLIEIVLDARRVVRVGGSFDDEVLSRVLNVLEARS